MTGRLEDWANSDPTGGPGEVTDPLKTLQIYDFRSKVSGHFGHFFPKSMSSCEIPLSSMLSVAHDDRLHMSITHEVMVKSRPQSLLVTVHARDLHILHTTLSYKCIFPQKICFIAKKWVTKYEKSKV